jgi:hypothetical protein
VSVEALIGYFAEVEPQQLDNLEVCVLRDVDDPEWSEPKRWMVHEARRRLLERIGQARQEVQ